MKFTKNHIFFPIVVLITGLATMPTYPGGGMSKESEEDRFAVQESFSGQQVQPDVSQTVPVPQDIISRLSFSKDNKFTQNEKVVVKTKQGNYEYRTIKDVGVPEGTIDMEVFDNFWSGKPVRGAGYKPGFQLDYPVNKGEVDHYGKPLIFTPSAKIGKIL